MLDNKHLSDINFCRIFLPLLPVYFLSWSLTTEHWEVLIEQVWLHNTGFYKQSAPNPVKKKIQSITVLLIEVCTFTWLVNLYISSFFYTIGNFKKIKMLLKWNVLFQPGPTLLWWLSARHPVLLCLFLHHCPDLMLTSVIPVKDNTSRNHCTSHYLSYSKQFLYIHMFPS